MLGEFLRKPAQRRRFGCRKFVGKCPEAFYLWGREGIWIRQRERLVSNVDPVEVYAVPQ